MEESIIEVRKEKEATPRRITQPTVLEMVEHTRVMYQVTPAAEVEVEDLEKPEFWAHVAGTLRPGDRIEVIPSDRHYYAELFVLASARNWAKVALMRYIQLLPDHERLVEDGYVIEWQGRSKWRVTKGDDELTSGHDTQAEAVRWLEDYKREIG